MSIKFVRLELSGKKLPLSKHGGLILIFMTQTREKWDCRILVDLTFEWYEYAMVFRVFIFIFLFRTNFRKWYLDESDFHHCHGNFFESAILKVTWSELFLKFFLNNCEAHGQQHFERHSTVEDFTDMDQDTC